MVKKYVKIHIYSKSKSLSEGYYILYSFILIMISRTPTRFPGATQTASSGDAAAAPSRAPPCFLPPRMWTGVGDDGRPLCPIERHREWNAGPTPTAVSAPFLRALVLAQICLRQNSTEDPCDGLFYCVPPLVGSGDPPYDVIPNGSQIPVTRQNFDDYYRRLQYLFNEL